MLQNKLTIETVDNNCINCLLSIDSRTGTLYWYSLSSYLNSLYWISYNHDFNYLRSIISREKLYWFKDYTFKASSIWL